MFCFGKANYRHFVCFWLSFSLTAKEADKKTCVSGIGKGKGMIIQQVVCCCCPTPFILRYNRLFVCLLLFFSLPECQSLDNIIKSRQCVRHELLSLALGGRHNVMLLAQFADTIGHFFFFFFLFVGSFFFHDF